MLDVHPPHEAAHSWNDFFIHIATITVGLLIAIGLEQTVEAVHHHHERRQLEMELREETQRNLDLVQLNIAHLRSLRDWTNSVIVALNSAPVANGQISRGVLPRQTILNGSLWTPSRTVWTVAKASGAVALLPEQEAQVYARVDFEAEQIQVDELEMKRSTAPLGIIIKSWSGLPPEQMQTFTVAQRDELVRALSMAADGVSKMMDYEVTESGACRGALNGARSVDEILRSIQRESKVSPTN